MGLDGLTGPAGGINSHTPASTADLNMGGHNIANVSTIGVGTINVGTGIFMFGNSIGSAGGYLLTNSNGMTPNGAGLNFDGGQISTDSNGNIVCNTLQAENGITVVNGPVNANDGLNVNSQRTSLDSGLILSDLFGGWSVQALTVLNSGKIHSATAAPCDFSGVPTIATSTIVEPIAKAAVQALCTALGIAQS